VQSRKKYENKVMMKNRLAVKISNRIKKWLYPFILSDNLWLRPLSEQIDNLKTLDPEYFSWIMKHKLIDSFAQLMLPEYHHSRNVLFTVVIPVYNTPSDILEKAVNSVVRQIYPVWEIIICDDASDSEDTIRCIRMLGSHNAGKLINGDHRIKIITNSHNRGISEATNICVKHADGRFIVFLDHDDELYPDALLKTKEAIDHNPHAKVFYSDEDYLSSDGYRHSYNFKPGFSPSLLETHNYILHMVCVKKELFVNVGGLRKDFDGSQDYDLLLRLMDMGERFVHIQDILYSWRENTTSMIGGMLKPEIFNRGKKALEEHYIRSGDNVEYIKDNLENIRGVYRTRFAMPDQTTILVVKIGNSDFRFDPYALLSSINIELLVWNPVHPFPINIVNAHKDLVIFLDSKLTPQSWHEFLNEMVPLVLRNSIGAVGAMIYSGDGKIMSAGRSLMPWGAMRNDFWGYDSVENNSPAKRTRDVIAVSGAAMAISCKMLRDVLMEGALDQAMWDVEICLRLHRSGHRVIFSPHASAFYKGALEEYHGRVMFDVRHITEKYGIFKDPYLNLNLIDNCNPEVTEKRSSIPSQFKKKRDDLTEEDEKRRGVKDKKKNDFYHKWLSFYSPDLRSSSERVAKLKYKPFFSIILPTYNSELIFFKELLQSLKSQTYTQFEVCISDDASTDPGFLEFLAMIDSVGVIKSEEIVVDSCGICKSYPENITVVYSDKNSGIAGNTNRAISIAKGEWFVLCDHDDLMEPFALEMIAQYINDNPEVDVLYSDEDMVDQKGWRHSPRLQPDWNPDMLLSHMYCPHIVSFKRELLDKVCREYKTVPFRSEMDGAQDYDFFLRLTEKAQSIGHIPMILYSWRSVLGSVALDACAKIYAYDAGKRALEAAMKRRKEDAVVLKASGTKLGVYRVKRKISMPCVPTHVVEVGSDFLLSIVNSIRNISPVAVDIVLVCRHCDEYCLETVNHLSDINIIMVKDSAGRSEMYNIGAEAAKGDHLIFSSKFIDLLDSDYPFGLLEHTQRDEIGAAGIKIIYPNGFFYHTGMLLGVNGVAGYAHRNIEQCPGHWHFASCIRNYSAVSWDCMGVSKKKFQEVDGFDLKLSQFGDVDFCLKLIEKGYKNLYTPYVAAVLNRSVHFLEELRNIKEEKIILERYGTLVNNDPMHHPLMSKDLEDFSIGF